MVNILRIGENRSYNNGHKIDTITLEIKGKKLELTLEECEELYNLLDKVITKKPEFTISSQWPVDGTGIINVPYRVGVYPPYTYPNITWCGTNGGFGTNTSQLNKDCTITATN